MRPASKPVRKSREPRESKQTFTGFWKRMEAWKRPKISFFHPRHRLSKALSMLLVPLRLLRLWQPTQLNHRFGALVKRADAIPSLQRVPNFALSCTAQRAGLRAAPTAWVRTLDINWTATCWRRKESAPTNTTMDALFPRFEILLQRQFISTRKAFAFWLNKMRVIFIELESCGRSSSTWKRLNDIAANGSYTTMHVTIMGSERLWLNSASQSANFGLKAKMIQRVSKLE
mmetsp:Transcript_13865/g.38328  ORF Transcript_13865/g.38328 Transcript_13865/m.38328 type:complete len:230 (+) Transcript_13865:2838-3527(+)